MTVCTRRQTITKMGKATVFPHRSIFCSDSAPHCCDNKGNLISRCQIDSVPRIVFGTRPFLLPRFGQAFAGKILMTRCASTNNIQIITYFPPFVKGVLRDFCGIFGGVKNRSKIKKKRPAHADRLFLYKGYESFKKQLVFRLKL